MPTWKKKSLMLMATAISTGLLAPDVTAQAPQPLPQQGQSASPFSHADVDQAWQIAQEKQFPLLVYATMDNCHFCHKMLAETYANPQVAYGLKQATVSAEITKEKHPALVEKLGIRAYPTTLLIAPNGDLLARIEGFAAPEQFIKTMRPGLIASAQQRQTAGLPSPESPRPR